MKKLAIAATLFITMAGAKAQSVSNGVALPRPADMLQVKDNSHNFGKIPQGRPAVYTFEVANTGSTPLMLDNVQASCGCTTPEWDHNAIAPGATTKIKVGYNAYADGPFTKTVTIVYNTNMTKTLTISGEVYKAPQTSAPENASLQILKQQ